MGHILGGIKLDANECLLILTDVARKIVHGLGW